MKFNPNRPETYPNKVDGERLSKMVLLIKNKMGDNKVVSINRKRDGQEYLIANNGSYDGWFLYEGCDLVIGDVTLKSLASVLLNELA